jgi:hypothetical protein
MPISTNNPTARKKWCSTRSAKPGASTVCPGSTCRSEPGAQSRYRASVKDTTALLRIAEEANVPLRIVESVVSVNERASAIRCARSSGLRRLGRHDHRDLGRDRQAEYR